MNIDFLGRGGGTGGLVARGGDIDNAVWNASGLARFSGEQGFAGYMDYLVETRGGIAGYAARSQSGAGYSIYLTYLSTGSVDRTDLDYPTGSGGEFNHGEVVLGVAGGAGLTGYLTGGAAFKVARQNTFDVTAGGMFADLSATLRCLPLDGGNDGGERAGGWRAYSGFVVRNLKLFRWGDEESSVPVNLELGLDVEVPGQGIDAGLSLYVADEGRREIRAGVAASPAEDFEVRIGYRRRVGAFSDSGSDLPWERGLSAGFGVGLGRVWVDYSYEDASPLDNVHRFGIRFRTGLPE